MNCPLCGRELPRCGMNCGERRMNCGMLPHEIKKGLFCNSPF
jgi:hypothetical protein